MKSNRHNTLALVVAAIALAAPSAAQTPDGRFDLYLWVDDAFTLDDAAQIRLRALGITGIDAEGPAGAARAAKTGMPYYVDHAVPKGFFHLRQHEFQAARDLWRADGAAKVLPRPACLRDPDALARARTALSATIAACGDSRPTFLSLTDEPSSTRGTNPVDWCRERHCDAEFPKFLAERWGSEQNAREVWAGRWPKDGAPEQVSTDEARRALFHEALPLSTVAQWNDTRAFADATLRGALDVLGAHARKERPGLDLALLGALMPSAFGGFDWEHLGPDFDVIEPYDWGAAHDLVRACAPQAQTWHTLTPHREGGPPLEHEIWRYFLRGDRGAILFDASAWTRADGRGATSALAAIAPLIEFLRSDALATFRRGAPFRPQVAILHSMASTRLHWLLDTRFDGTTWTERLSSHDALYSSESQNREAWTAILADLGLQHRFVTPAQLRGGALLDDGIAAVVLPRAIAMSDAEVSAITAASATRFLVADCQLALFNARLQKRDRPALDDLFGVTRPKLRGVDDFDAANPDTRKSTGFVAAEPQLRLAGANPTHAAGTTPLVLVHGVGAGRTAYLNLRVGGYIHHRIADPAAAERLRAVLRPLFVAGRVRPRFEVTEIAPGRLWPYAVHARKLGSEIVIAIELAATTGARPIDWTGPIGKERSRVRVTLPGTYQVTDLWTGEPLGPLNSIETEVAATRPALYRLRP